MSVHPLLITSKRVNKKSMLIPHSERKLGVQVNRCAFSTLNRDRAIKGKHSPPDDRKGIKSFCSQVVDLQLDMVDSNPNVAQATGFLSSRQFGILNVFSLFKYLLGEV